MAEEDNSNDNEYILTLHEDDDYDLGDLETSSDVTEKDLSRDEGDMELGEIAAAAEDDATRGDQREDILSADEEEDESRPVNDKKRSKATNEKTTRLDGKNALKDGARVESAEGGAKKSKKEAAANTASSKKPIDQRKKIVKIVGDDVSGRPENFIITVKSSEEEIKDRKLDVYERELSEVERQIKEITGNKQEKSESKQKSQQPAKKPEKKLMEKPKKEEREKKGQIIESGEDSSSWSSCDSSSCSSRSNSIRKDEGVRKRRGRSKSSIAESIEAKKQKKTRLKSEKRSSSKTPLRHSSKSKGSSSDNLRPFFRDTRYFLIKSGNAENVILSKVKGVWSTTPRNEAMLNRAFKRHKNVLLIFSVEKSQAYQGFCRMSSEATHGGSPVNWVLPPGMNARVLGGVFKVQWLNRNEVPFRDVSRMINPWNENKPIKIARDGTEFAPSVGKRLCRAFPRDDACVDLVVVGGGRSRRSTSSSSTSPPPIRRPLTPPRGVLSAAAMERMRRYRNFDARRPPPFRRGGVVGRRSPAPRDDRRRFSPPTRRRPLPPTPPRQSTSMRRNVDRRPPTTTASATSKDYDYLLINGSYYDYITQFSTSYAASAANALSLLATTMPGSYSSADSAYQQYYGGNCYPPGTDGLPMGSGFDPASQSAVRAPRPASPSFRRKDYVGEDRYRTNKGNFDPRSSGRSMTSRASGGARRWSRRPSPPPPPPRQSSSFRRGRRRSPSPPPRRGNYRRDFRRLR